MVDTIFFVVTSGAMSGKYEDYIIQYANIFNQNYGEIKSHVEMRNANLCSLI